MVSAGIPRHSVLLALALADGQSTRGFDMGHTAEVMYGRQADAVMALYGGYFGAMAAHIDALAPTAPDPATTSALVLVAKRIREAVGATS